MKLKSFSPERPSSVNLFSQVEAVQAHWLEVCNFFAQVQCAETEGVMDKLGANLPTVEKNLDIIIEELTKERKEWIKGADHTCQSQTHARHPSVANSAARGQISQEPPSPMVCRGASQGLGAAGSMSSSDALDQKPCTSGTTLFLLPPCYFYLFGDFALHLPYDEDPLPLPDKDSDGAINTTDSVHSKGEGAEDDSPPHRHSKFTSGVREASSSPTAAAPLTIGPLFLLTLCMFAKHNQPVGARVVILRFLTRLLSEADVPPFLRAQYAHLYPISAPRSVFQITPDSSIVPLLDMIRRVSRDLIPASDLQWAETPKKALLLPESRALRACEPRHTNPCGSADQETNTAAERLEFVRFLCALAEKIEQVPDLANFFITIRDAAAGGGSGSALDASSTDQPPEAGDKESKHNEIFELLKVLLTYLTHDGAPSDWQQRRDTSRFALSAVASLAKCPDPWVQDIVASEAGIVNRTLSGACHTLITLCKIQGNDDSEVQKCYLLDVFRFWSTLTVSAPVVASQLRLLEHIEKDFVQMALVPLLASPDSIVYAAACLLTAVLLDELNSCASAVAETFGRVLLTSVVHASNGRRCHEVPDYYTYWMAAHEQECGKGVHDSVVSADLYTSFFNFYILTHLTPTPTLSEESLMIRDSHKIAFTEWTATEASLVLTKSFAENLPVMFLKYVLFLDIQTLRDMWKKFDSGHMDPHSEGGRRLRGWFATTFAPLIEVNDCFPAHLRTANKRICGVTDEQLSKEVLERMLRIESNAPLHYLNLRQLSEGSFFQEFSDPLASSLERQEGAPKDRRDTEELSLMSTDEADKDARHTLTKDSPTSAVPDEARNAWFHKGPHEAPLILSLSRILLKLFDLPYRVNILLSETLTTICLLPDLRALYTLMDPERGRLYHSLRVLRDSIDRLLDGDKKASMVMTDAAATTSDRKGAGKRKERTTRDSDQGSGVDKKSLSLTSLSEASKFPTLTFLYNAYLENWDCLPPPALWGCDDLCGQRPPICRLPTSLSDEVGKGLVKNQLFLQSCVALETLRLELSAVVGYMTLSHSLLNLQPGKAK